MTKIKLTEAQDLALVTFAELPLASSNDEWAEALGCSTQNVLTHKKALLAALLISVVPGKARSTRLTAIGAKYLKGKR